MSNDRGDDGLAGEKMKIANKVRVTAAMAAVVLTLLIGASAAMAADASLVNYVDENGVMQTAYTYSTMEVEPAAPEVAAPKQDGGPSGVIARTTDEGWVGTPSSSGATNAYITTTFKSLAGVTLKTATTLVPGTRR